MNNESNIKCQYDLAFPYGGPEHNHERLSLLLDKPVASFAELLENCPSAFQHLFPAGMADIKMREYTSDGEVEKT
jgi:hypothetical protein